MERLGGVGLALGVWGAGLAMAASAIEMPATWTYPVQGPPLSARHGAVCTVSPEASRVGLEILQHGGNAVDAAVAIGLAMAVTWPEAGNLGGGGFMLVRTPVTCVALDYRETAPASASAGMFLDAKGDVTDLGLTSRLGVGIPGTVRGLSTVHQRFGHLPWVTVVAPAIRLARDGFLVDQGLAASFERYQADLRRDPEASRIFLPQGLPLKLGDRLIQKDLAATLERISAAGSEGFYQGTVARAIARDMEQHGGIITEADLATYLPAWRAPLSFVYHGKRIYSMPPPSSGGVILSQVMQMLEKDDLPALGYHSAAMIHLVAEAERRSFADRNAYLGDPDFVANPLKALLDPAYLARRRSTISPDRAQPSYSTMPGLDEHLQTTHFVVADARGNVVSNTYTLNGAYGCGIVAPGTGVLLNNEMDDFTAKPGAANMFGLVQGARNAIAPHKRMLSSMSPTIVMDEKGQFLLATGSPGGSTIPTTTLQVLLNVLDYGMNAREAIVAPRFHHQGLPQTIDMEPGGFDPAVSRQLTAMGHPLKERPLGDAQLIIRKGDGTLEAWADPRKGGLALGF